MFCRVVIQKGNRMGPKYSIIEIVDEEVPLASIPNLNSYNTLIAVIAALVILGLVVSYMYKCRMYRMKISEFDTVDDKYFGWNLFKLRDTYEELEFEKVNRLGDAMQQLFSTD